MPNSAAHSAAREASCHLHGFALARLWLRTLNELDFYYPVVPGFALVGESVRAHTIPTHA